MGADNSTFQLEKGEAYLNYYCLTIRETNTIRVIHANKDVKKIISKVRSFFESFHGVFVTYYGVLRLSLEIVRLFMEIVDFLWRL